MLTRFMTDVQKINWSDGNWFPENSGYSPQGVLRLSGRELLFGEAGRLVANKFTPLANLRNRQGTGLEHLGGGVRL
jgi:hypothetical protein